jgi:hypothetical protein
METQQPLGLTKSPGPLNAMETHPLRPVQPDGDTRANVPNRNKPLQPQGQCQRTTPVLGPVSFLGPESEQKDRAQHSEGSAGEGLGSHEHPKWPQTQYTRSQETFTLPQQPPLQSKDTSVPMHDAHLVQTSQ